MARQLSFPEDIPGASDPFTWFGYWPTFHDGEVLSVHLNRAGPSHLRVHTWEGTHELDSNGYGVLQKHVIVTFVIEEIRDLELNGFSHQNVLSALIVRKDPNGYQLELGPCYGICGTINVGLVRIELEPGKPLG